MKIKFIICVLMSVIMLTSVTGCNKNKTVGDDVPADTVNTTQGPKDTSDGSDVTTTPSDNSEIPSAFLEPMKKLLAEWGIRKGSISDPLIGARILMYEKTKDEVGYAILDIDDNGVLDMIVAPMDGFAQNGLVYDILTIKDSEAFHLANSLQATYHFMDDGSFILRTPTEDGSYTFKRVTLNGDNKPTEVEITKEESAKYYISTVELIPFSSLEN